jgi:hypothetical protein
VPWPNFWRETGRPSMLACGVPVGHGVAQPSVEMLWCRCLKAVRNALATDDRDSVRDASSAEHGGLRAAAAVHLSQLA